MLRLTSVHVIKPDVRDLWLALNSKTPAVVAGVCPACVKVVSDSSCEPAHCALRRFRADMQVTCVGFVRGTGHLGRVTLSARTKMHDKIVNCVGLARHITGTRALVVTILGYVTAARAGSSLDRSHSPLVRAQVLRSGHHAFLA